MARPDLPKVTGSDWSAIREALDVAADTFTADAAALTRIGRAYPSNGGEHYRAAEASQRKARECRRLAEVAEILKHRTEG